MKRALKSEESGPMDRFVKKMVANQTSGKESPPASPQPVEKKQKLTENESHNTHSFECQLSNSKATTLTCNTAGTVEDVLKTSSQFCKIAKKNLNKELVILKDGKALSSHFPCCLVRDERLIVNFIQADGRKKNPVHPQRKVQPDELVTFHVLTQGGKNITKVMTNPALKTKVSEIIVYAYKGEKVKQALKRDGRLEELVFKKNCALSDMSTEVNTEMSSLVDALEGKTFKIVLLDRSPAPESQPGSLDDADLMQNQSDEGKSSPVPPGPTQSANENPSESKPNHARAETFREIPNSKKMQSHLFSQFKEGVKKLGNPNVSRRSRDQTLLDVEYGKNSEACLEVRTMKILMHLSDSVCHVRINGSPGGSGFLLFDRFVLTNAHVVRSIYDENTGQFRETITVHFSFEGLNEIEGQSVLEVEEIVAYEYCLDVSGYKCDWALLKLRPDQTLPDRLLERFNLLPRCGGICIIGHPDGGVKKIDPCFIVPPHEYRQVVEKHSSENPDGVLVDNADYSGSNTPIQLVTRNFFNGMEKTIEQNRNVLTYESCFYFGSSGSPVFDRHCNVVAMHSGGYPYRNARGQLKSLIEYGYPLSDILERMIIQIVTRERWDVLKEYLTFSDTKQTHVMANVKQLVESRNLIAFKNAVDNSAAASDEKCKAFFEFLSRS